ncbi:MAG TPA: peptidoglycan DD-metalloendopeptidase family protein [Reyranella sp.]|nr:peptidoglycan DD-metalloendopeptidase family protein [Reyranella sp.]
MKRLTRWAAVGVVAAAVAAPIALLAQSEPSSAPSSAATDTGAPNWIRQSTVDSQTQLSELEASLSLSTERVAALKAELEAIKGDRDKQNAALIAAGERVRLAETEVAAVQQKIGDLIVEELDTRGRLDGADKSISNVLAALERISRNPPPALIVDPSDALGSARSAILISAILPQLQAKADAVMADLNALNEIKLAAQAEEENLRANFEVLEEEQLRIATLIAARNSSEETATAALAAEEQEAALMAEKAAELKQLIADLGKRADAVATAAAATEQANAGGNAPKLDRETVLMALANPERTEPALPFASVRGYLSFPVSGVNVINYGDGDGFGGISKGLSVVTRAQAPVIAPADGTVLYAGAYLNYGQIVILDVGQDHTILLAGLEAVEAKVGQFVRMGDRLGAMGSRTIGRTVATSAGASNPTLYIEMRNSNSPIDPTGWWASPTNTTQSG